MQNKLVLIKSPVKCFSITVWLNILQEIECLQDNFEDLSESCQEAVGNFTEDEDEDIELDKILMKSCTPMIKKFCQVELIMQFCSVMSIGLWVKFAPNGKIWIYWQMRQVRQKCFCLPCQ